MDADAPPVPPGVRRVQVAPERLPVWLRGFADRHGAGVVASTTEQVYLRGADGAQCWIEVPFAPAALGSAMAREQVLDALVEHVLLPRTVGVVLVRRGGYAAGVFVGTELIASKVGSSYVQGTTKAGGWSQQRYARRRANQSRAAFADAADATARTLLPRLADLDAVIGGGDHGALDAVLADARLSAVRALLTPPFLAVPDPRLRVLTDSAEQWRAVTIRLEP